MEAGDDMAAHDSGPGRQGVGDLLRARRVELGLSQIEVANMVKLPPRRIEAMEQERWGELPDGPYLRGFLRNVAKALNLDPVELVARVDASQGFVGSSARVLIAPGATNIALPRRSGPADDRRGGRTLVFGAFAFALVAALIAWSGTASFDRVVAAGRTLIDPSRRGVATVASNSAGMPAASAAVSDGGSGAPTVEPAVSPAPASTSPEDPSTMPKAPLIAAAPSAPAASDQVLQFHFNDQSWVEVRSSDGKVLLQRLNAAGSEQAIDGAPPFALIVGNAKGVVLRFRGQPVDLAPYTRDSVARFTLS